MRILLLFLITCWGVYAQHDMSHMSHDDMPQSHMDMTKPDTSKMDMTNMDMSGADAAMQASGTAFNPAASPMPMVSVPAGRWRLMFHGAAFVSDIQQTGPRGGDKFASMNWFMGRAIHPLAGGDFSVRVMLSLEPATVPDRRYPELFQTGETAYGKALVDAQHPHDLFMELALEYSHRVAEHGSAWIYAAPVGDPALGPVAFPHRVSAMELPQATLAHHLQDSTHISNEVVTAGFTTGKIGIEASGFHGAEPNENRWNIDHGAIDSYSARVTFTPTARWSAQVSAGHLTQPEALEPGDQTRITASATYVRPYSGGEWASSLIWGRVHKIADKANLNGYGFESVARFRTLNYVTGRVELVDKDELFGPGNPLEGRTFRIKAFTAGYTRDFKLFPHITTGLGSNVTLYSLPFVVHEQYGAHPVAVLVFLRFRLRGA